METYRYLLDLALILLSTKALGLLTRRVHLSLIHIFHERYPGGWGKPADK